MRKIIIINGGAGVGKTEMVKKGTGLFCPECKYSVPRKLADDYGDVKI